MTKRKKLSEPTLTYASPTHGIFSCSETRFVTLQNWFRFGTCNYPENKNIPNWVYLMKLLDELTDNDYRDVDSIAATLIILGDIGYEPDVG